MTAHSRFVKLALLASSMMAVSGCICTTGGGVSGDLVFTWTLNGSPCASVPDVNTVVVKIAGETLENNGVYACNTAGSDGIRLKNFRPRSYSYTVEAVSRQGVVLYAASGTVVVNGETYESVNLIPTSAARQGAINFYWTFEGQSCVQAGVATLTVSVPGLSLPNGGVYNCINGSEGGVRLENIPGGSYSYTIQAVGSGGVTYSASSSVMVNGETNIIIDLKQPVAANQARFSWRIPTGSNVTCQYLKEVEVLVDNVSRVRAACSSGINGSTVTVTSIQPGQHTYTFLGLGSDDVYYYRTDGSFTVSSTGSVSVDDELDWAVGTPALRFQFNNQGTVLTCAQAGVTVVQMTFRDVSAVAPDFVVDVDCRYPGFTVDGATPYVYAGTYDVYASAIGSAGTYTSFGTGAPAPARVTVEAGVFTTLSSSSPQVIIFR